MPHPVRLSLLLGALVRVASPHECSGNQAAPPYLTSTIQFGLQCSTIAFSEELDNIASVTSAQACANECALHKDCGIAVWNDEASKCVLKHKMEPGEDDFDPRLNYHTLVRVGFLNETISQGNGQCSKDQIDQECANAVRDEQSKAAEECTKRLGDIQNSAANDRLARERAERECADKLYREQQTIARNKRECDTNLSKEIAERERAVREERDRVERLCRTERDRVIQREKDRIEAKCESDRKSAIGAERDEAARKCAAAMDQALQDAKNQSDRQCEMARDRAVQEEKDRGARECAADRQQALQDEKDRSERQCKAEKDQGLQDERRQCSIDQARAVQDEKDRSERQCKLEKDQGMQDERRQCNIDQARALEDERSRNERNCERERDAALRDQQNIADRQCKNEKDQALKDERELVERKCESERERLLENERDNCKRQSAENQDRAIRDERERADKECTDRFQQEQTRRRDDISFNPGFQAWPETITDFDIDGATYVLRVRSRVSLAATDDHDTTSPAACVRTYCNNDPMCFGIGWDPRKENKCTTYMDSPYRRVQAKDIDAYPHQNMIVKRDRMA